MKNDDQIKKPISDWPVSFKAVEQDHLKQMLKMTPAQRLALAEELLDFAIKADAVKTPKEDSSFNL